MRFPQQGRAHARMRRCVTSLKRRMRFEHEIAGYLAEAPKICAVAKGEYTEMRRPPDCCVYYPLASPARPARLFFTFLPSLSMGDLRCDCDRRRAALENVAGWPVVPFPLRGKAASFPQRGAASKVCLKASS